MFQFQVSHDVKRGLKVAFTGLSEVRGQQRDFSRYVNASDFNHPSHAANKVHVKGCSVRVKGFGVVGVRVIRRGKRVVGCFRYTMPSVEILGQVRGTVGDSLLDVFGWAEGPRSDTIGKLCLLELCAQVNVGVADRGRIKLQVGVDTSKDSHGVMVYYKNIINITQDI